MMLAGTKVADFQEARCETIRRRASSRPPVCGQRKPGERRACVIVVDPFHAGEALVAEALKSGSCVIAVFTLAMNFCVAELTSYQSLADNPDVEIIFAAEGDHAALVQRF